MLVRCFRFFFLLLVGTAFVATPAYGELCLDGAPCETPVIVQVHNCCIGLPCETPESPKAPEKSSCMVEAPAPLANPVRTSVDLSHHPVALFAVVPPALLMEASVPGEVGELSLPSQLDPRQGRGSRAPPVRALSV